MTNKSGRTKHRTNNLRDELNLGPIQSGDKGWCIIAPIERYSSYRYFQYKKKSLAIIDVLILFNPFPPNDTF